MPQKQSEEQKATEAHCVPERKLAMHKVVIRFGHFPSSMHNISIGPGTYFVVLRTTTAVSRKSFGEGRRL
jgi:hypothetical protein